VIARSRATPGALRQGGPGPLDEFFHAIDFTWFDTRPGRLIPLAFAAFVALVAADAGPQPAITVAGGVSALLVLTSVSMERDRWHAQDVVAWYQQERRERWILDTGSPSPIGDPIAAEIWLGVHRRGTVPQLYRALAALNAGDALVIGRELEAMPDSTPTERAWRIWFVENRRWNETGVAEVTALAALVPILPISRDQETFRSWLAIVESHRRRAAKDRRWIEPMVERRRSARRPARSKRRRARIWYSRFEAVPVFWVQAVVFASIAVQLAQRS
jgi:hypothetical protein